MRRKIPWRKEREITDVLEPFFASRGYLVFREQYVSWRRADLIAILPDEKIIAERLEHSFNPSSIVGFFRILRILEKEGPMTLRELAKKTVYSPGFLRRLLNESRPYIVKTGNAIRLGEPYTGYAKEVVAVEVKLDNWKLGLVQAYDYLHGANKSYLAIPVELWEEVERFPEIIDWAKERGIGMLLIHPDRRVEERIPAMYQEPRSKRASQRLLETLWRKILEKQRSA